jgi:hypothetical protein
MTGQWEDRTPPAVRPYVITGGRAGEAEEPLPWEALVVASGTRPPRTLQPEYLRILEACRGLLSVAEVAAHLDQPPPVVQVLLRDLLDWGLVETREAAANDRRTDPDLLRKVLNGLESRL